MTQHDPELERLLKSTGTEWGSSRWDEAARCEVAYALRYEPGKHRLKLAPPAPREAATEAPEAEDSGLPRGYKSSLAVGSLVHACLAAEAEAELGQDSATWRIVLGYAADTQTNRWDPADIFEARRLMCAYESQWGLRWDSWPLTHGTVLCSVRVLAVELPLRSQIGDAPHTTQVDIVLEDMTGRIWNVDHKTRGQRPSKEDPEGALRLEARVRPQFLATSVLLREHYNLDYYPGVILNSIIKTKQPCFYRVPVLLQDRTIELWREAQEFRAARRMHGEPPIPNLRECAGHPYGNCDFYATCHGNE